MPSDNSEIKQSHEFEFTGKAGEYFKIWIVNIVLTILTLGVYSAWAKVRNKRYFYGNTHLDGSSFEYTANPVSILKGRLIAFAVIGVYAAAVRFYPVTEPIFWLIFVTALPVLVVKALMFNARNSVFRNIRFDFRGRYGDAFTVLVGFMLLNIVTLGLAIPYYVYREKHFVVANSGFGVSRFGFDATAKSFYGVYLKAFGLLIPWARIRIMRYRFENLSVESTGGLDAFVAGMQGDIKATGEELADMLDIDLGL